MAGIYNSVDELVGGTPLVRLAKIKENLKLKAEVFAKVEFFNPGGSVKDRVAKSMLDTAEREGKLKSGGTIIEPTSGNTGIGLSLIAASRGYNVIIVMPETMSLERRQLVKAYGANLVLTDGAKGMKGAIEKAEEIAASIPESFIAGQFVNPANPEIHFKTTGPEIYDALDGKVDFFVSGVGTGGTISGVGGYLKSKNSDVKIIAVEPFDSPVLSGGVAGSHKIQGLGAGFIPETLDKNIYDSIMRVKTEEAFEYARIAGRFEGLLVGISSGAALWAAIKLAKEDENTGKNIVVLLPDTGERYLSTPIFDEL